MEVYYWSARRIPQYFPTKPLMRWKLLDELADRCVILYQYGVSERKVVIGILIESLGLKILMQALRLSWLSVLFSFTTSDGWMLL